ncbi:Hypothetical protein GLP15_334 [Giardia lamblia P15]|uniref:Uncharacterized protein n=1 Tax=Giardia intestinalis (strain P15) TaxID=658858 RepID=E1F3R5_GIAIA|nr:Hypothetical protein GLP15_334 [Giardia lamblia P15]
MDFNGIVHPTGFSRPATFIRGCTLCTALQDTILYSDGHDVYMTKWLGSQKQEEAAGISAELLQLIFLDQGKVSTDSDPIIVLHALPDAPKKHVALATLSGAVYLAELTDSTLYLAILHHTKCYGAKAFLSGSIESRKLLGVLCTNASHLLIFDIEEATLLFETCIDVDVPVSGAFSGSNLYIICRQSLIVYDIIYRRDTPISVMFKSFVRLPLNGARVLCSRFAHSGIFLLGLNTRQVCAVDKAGAPVSTWCKVSKYEPLYVLDSKETTDIERITIAAVSNEVTTQQQGSKERISEFRTDGMIIGMAETATFLVFLTEETIYFYFRDKNKWSNVY